MGAPYFRDDQSGGQGESTSNTLVSLYLILLTFFIAMQALVDGPGVQGEAVIENVNKTFGGAPLGAPGIAAGQGKSGGVAAALDGIIRRQIGLRYEQGERAQGERVVFASLEFFFAPNSPDIRRDRLAVIKTMSDVLEQGDGRWRLDILLPFESTYKHGRSQALHAAFVNAGVAKPLLMLGQDWTQRDVVQLRFVQHGHEGAL